MVSNGEAMRFFVNAGDEFGDVGFAAGFDWILILHDDFEGGVVGMVARFVAADDWDFEWLYEWQDCVELADAAIEDDEVWEFPFGVFETTRDNFLHTL